MSFCVLADTHVHFHRCFDRSAFFERALANFKHTESTLQGTNTTHLLCLTEKSGDDFFGSLREQNVEQLSRTTKLVQLSAEDSIYVVLGRQINCREGLEILALNTDAQFNDREPFRESIAAAKASGATVVVNWCFGKWWGKRGTILRTFLSEGLFSDCYVGDVPLRFSKTMDSELIGELLGRSQGILYGSDPLPFRGDSGIAGSFGSFAMLNSAPAVETVGGMTALLSQLGRSQTSYGRRNSPFGFLRRQLANELYRKR